MYLLLFTVGDVMGPPQHPQLPWRVMEGAEPAAGLQAGLQLLYNTLQRNNVSSN